MKLYHVSFDSCEPETKLFFPRVPSSAGVGEDKSLKRICLAPTIELCIQALPSDSRNFESNFRIYEAEIDENDINLIHPHELYSKGYVPDALENQEYWYQKELLMHSFLAKVVSFEREYELAWSCLKVKDVENSIRKLCIGKSIDEQNSFERLISKKYDLPEDLYVDAIQYAESIKDWDFVDSLWEALGSLPWGSIIKFSKIEYKKCA